jgi:hypothetical protein
MLSQLSQWLVVLALALSSSACSGTSKPVHDEASTRDKQASAAPRARTIHPASGSDECVEMYGTCTPPPDPLCTSNALVLKCGESAELPSNGERLSCACP